MDRYEDIMQQAIVIFGGKEAAENWMHQPAMALDHRKPIEIIRASGGAEILESYLTQIEYGVYC
ncbi:MbcA/ParS/Xre antitoxin family protein [Roseovarius nanhaiticus]|uniref:MbcA/ParS/Xre antitoxin family protein n=1 Tax=Roseovarius nanhaiticus TaxID=573024 RepID=UPI002491391A|nr:MbcA/ParS/Xre antitoxin family protein [Roseovarius nanhaiticus]